jgi:hypothetical protein
MCGDIPLPPCDKIEKNEKGGACSAYGGEERCIQSFGAETLREIDHLGDPGVDGRKKKLDLQEVGCGGGYGLDQVGSG